MRRCAREELTDSFTFVRGHRRDINESLHNDSNQHFRKSAFQGGLVTAALGAAFHFGIEWMAAAVFVLASQRLQVLKAHAVPAGLLYGAAVYFFMNYLVLPLSAVAPARFQLGLFLNGVIGHALFVGLPISLFARRAQ